MRACATSCLALPSTIDVLLLNAGRAHGNVQVVMTANQLGHFLFTGLVFLKLAPTARISSVSSLAHNITQPIPWENISADNIDSNSYAYSKLANLLFVEQLNRLLVLKDSSIIAGGAHPGFAKSDIISEIDSGGIKKAIFSLVIRLYGQPTAHGAWTLLMTATDPGITRDSYYAPSRSTLVMNDVYGPPTRNGLKGKAVTDKEAAEKCWKESERKFDFKI